MQKRILVIDDDPDILDALCMFLTDEGFSVESISRGDDAADKAHSFDPSVILLDVLLSGKDGREICRAFKADKTLKKIPIIMISAHPNAETSVKQAGADDFLAKPFDVDQLLTVINNHIKPASVH